MSRLQHDSFQCGVWLCWAVDLLISAAADGQAWTKASLLNLLNDAVSLNLTSVRVRDGGPRFIEDVRGGYVASLWRAASSNSLLVTYSDDGAVAPLS